MLGHCLLAPCASLSLGAAANLPRLCVFYPFLGCRLDRHSFSEGSHTAITALIG